MALYTMLLLQDGNPVQKINVECGDDLDALDAARPFACNSVVEVYSAIRLVARVKVGDEPPNPTDKVVECGNQ